ncbi:recombinase family protein [Bremerella sp. P1]|uniref:recombinase family protein n=1 Tax=Bremerella sp. P1 TaxID=3026424 RepID=UPI002368210D|nr:recombinase family protein [Bremerella sp. P1]WDI40474.1 recombinase family protein [Bremerella sp. P1]
MTRTRSKRNESHRDVVRCAIYTRKSTEEGLDQEFNTLDAQRESGEAYIVSQRHEGWECLPDRYDDGGFTGGNMDRPALRRLMADIEAGKVDCVIVYKVDRLSRSLLDFARIMETFDRHNVSFVSVTQQFNTSTSMGRLVLNVLLSFAQFEREIISERTRDKIAAARRKGKWSGGMPLLGYNVDPQGSKLVVNETEADRVRAIFNLYSEHQSLLAVVAELDERGWVNKRWTTKKGIERGGKRFTKTSLHKLLTNVTYIGKLRYKDEVHDGEHEAIVSTDVWQRVQSLLSRNGRTGGAAVRNKFGALLKGILHCSACGTAMSPSHSTKNGNKRYRYYVCTNAQKRGWHNCPSKSIPAGEIERFVVEQIRAIGHDPTMVRDTVAQARSLGQSERLGLESELRGVRRDVAHWDAEVRELLPQVEPGDRETPARKRLADLQERIRSGEQRATDIQEQLLALDRTMIDEADVAAALAKFDPVWEALAPREQVRLIDLLIERIDYDGGTGDVSIAFHAAGIRQLADQIETEDAA